MSTTPPTAQELFDWLKSRQHRGEGWEVVNTRTGGIALQQSIHAISRTPEDAIFHALTNAAVASAKTDSYRARICAENHRPD